MYAKIITGTQKPHMEGEAIRWLREKWAPLLQKANGFISYYAMVEPQTDKVVIITFWENQEDLRSFYQREDAMKLAKQAPASWSSESTIADYAVRLAVDPKNIDCPEEEGGRD
ncbi:MAG TPA: antibiotic biosynthesis monooxygenase [Chloroflexia bacterium]|nr:antibiotic biosynthesis monooxygenase [Chloroflexia bacterium]